MGNREMNGITEHELKGERQEVSSVEQQYQEAKDYLVSLTKFGMNFGLGRIEELLKRVGNPEERLRVVHIGNP